ncbi:hypothetical protein EW146_g3057 [Bondarzewia mesenterica]|uniref:Peptidase M20 dimerisation domain-containing protein n=1 Tax=Bondarzewia mesenterica TaxID=1095465 RepID=A0A4S4LZ13_9AGAM|nr:hypothetical protein EW146_g3057 [Bondarzewia mesenterica]
MVGVGKLAGCIQPLEHKLLELYEWAKRSPTDLRSRGRPRHGCRGTPAKTCRSSIMTFGSVKHSEEDRVVLPSTNPPRSNSRSKWNHLVLGLALCLLIAICSPVDWQTRILLAALDQSGAEQCPQVEPMYPVKNAELWKSLGVTFGTHKFKTKAIAWLAGAVRVPTESYDNMDPVGTDPRWGTFGPFHDYLSKEYPLVHSHLELIKVNTYGLVYVWKGSDESLKPLLLAAHQALITGGYAERYGTVIATAGIAEKGYLDTMIEIASPGGHSSIPPPHTSIGMLSALLVEYEANPFKVHLSRAAPIYSNVQCLGVHAKDIPPRVRRLIKASAYSDKALKQIEKILFEDSMFKENVYKALAGTSQAIDLIQGGVKTNALPEQAWAVVNHRIATDRCAKRSPFRICHNTSENLHTAYSSVAEIMRRDMELLKPLAERFNLTYTAFGTAISPEDAPAYGSLTLRDPWVSALEPAPVTPTGPDAIPYRILSGTIKATYNGHRGLEGDNIVVTPGHSTDTQYYWKLTPHIIRYNHKGSGEGKASLPSGVHTVNEHIRADDYIEMIRFFVTLILNFDESATL